MLDRGLRAVAEDDREVADLQQGRLLAGRVRSCQVLARIEGVAHALADEDQQDQKPAEDDEARDAEPGRLEVGLALMQQIAQGGRAGRQAEAEEIQRASAA